MAIDRRLLDILCCPVSKVPVRPVRPEELQALNGEVAARRARDVAGVLVEQPIEDALITTDGRVIYRIADGIPVMLPDQGIGTTQFDRFPQ